MSEPAPAATVRALTQRRRRLLPRAAGALLLVLAALTAALASPAAVRADPASPTPAPTAGPTATPLPTASSTTAPTVTPLPAASPRYSGGGGIITSLIFGPAIDAVAGWITGSAVSAADDVIGIFVVDPANPDLTAPWFLSAYYGTGPAGGRTGPPGAVVIAAWLMLLVVLASVMSGVIRGDIAGMVRLVCVRLPVAIFITYIAIWLVTQLLALTNLATAWEVGGNAQAGSLAAWSNILGSNLGSDFLTVLACLVLIAATRGLLPRVAGPGRRHLRGGGLHPPDRPDLTVARRAQRPEADRRDALRALHQQVRDGLRSGPGGERAHPIHHPQRKPGLRARRDTDLPACGAGALRSLPPSPPARGDRGRRHGRPCLGHRQAGRQRRRPHRCSGRRRRRIRRHLGGGRRRCRHEQRGLIRLPHPRLWARRDGGTGRAEDCRRRGPARWWTAGQWPRGRRRLPRGRAGGGRPVAQRRTPGPTPAALDASAPSGSTNQPATAGAGPAIASTQPRRTTPQQEGSPA